MMKKIISIISLLLLSVFILTSCDDKSSNNNNKPSESQESSTNPTNKDEDESEQTTPQEDVYFDVVFKDYDGTILDTQSVKEGTTPTYNKSNPARENDESYKYIFNGWNPSLGSVTTNTTYVAQYTRTLKDYYNVQFVDYDGTILNTQNVAGGTTPTYSKSNPVRQNDDNYKYTFSGWSPTLSNVTTDTVYVAQYTRTELPYTISFDLDNGTSASGVSTIKIETLTKDKFKFDITKPKYVFRGWEYNGTQVFDENGNIINNITLQSNMTFKAIFEESITLVITYSIYNPKTNQLINTYTTKPNDLGSVSETRSYHWNTPVNLFANPNEGYTFIGWYYNGIALSNENNYNYMMWEDDITIEARFAYTQYDLNVWSNNIDLGQVMIRNGYSQVWYDDQTQKQYYAESTTIAAYTKTDVRFLGWYDENNNLVSTSAVYSFTMLNRDYTLEAKWNYFNITYDLDGGTNNVNNPTFYNKDMSNIQLLNPAKDGYTFQGWEYKGNIITEINIANLCHMELKAKWSVHTNTSYKVEHYLQNLDDDNYPDTPYEVDNLTGTTDTLTNGEVNIYEGFTSPIITQENINGDGSTVISLFYTRNSYSLTLYINNTKAGTITNVSGTYKYGKEITIDATTNPGYTFNGLYDGDNQVSPLESYTFNMTASNISYEARWTANTNTPYKVEHYLQNIDDDNYPELPYETNNLTGTTDALTNGEVNTYEGFTSPTISQVNIDGDGSSLIKLYYTRNSYKVSINQNNYYAGSVSGSGTYKYGELCTINASTTQKYTFIGWYLNEEYISNNLSYTIKMASHDLCYKAYWVETPVILSRNNANAGNVSIGNQRIVGKNVTIRATTNLGYTFNGWYLNDEQVTTELLYTFIMPEEKTTYTAKWSANTNTPYTVEYYLQNLGDDNYPDTPYEVDNLTGITDTLTNVYAKEYDGFTTPPVTQVNINGDGSSLIKLYYTRNSYKVSLIKDIIKAGTVTGAGTYKFGKEIIISTINPGYTFDGWYLNGFLYCEEESFNYTVDAMAIEFEARYTINQYSISIDNQTDGVIITGITSGDMYDYDKQIILIATNIPNGYSIKWMRSDGITIICDNYLFRVPSNDLYIITIITDEKYIRNENNIYFGSYPQSKVEDEILISQLNSLAGELPTSSNLYNWTDYNYYMSGNITSYMYYQDIDLDDNGTFDFRGVYFNNYRPTMTNKADFSHQEENGYLINTVYWFIYESIEWNILSESNAQVLIIANLVLDSQDYYSSGSNDKFAHNGDVGYANNYKLSNIRKWLNETFYSVAFSELQKTLIRTTLVDNTSHVDESFSCSNTYDKMFLLSTDDAYAYYSNKVERIAKGTEYAKSQGLYCLLKDACLWRLRTPIESNYPYFVITINSSGEIFDSYCYNIGIGVRPACWIKI